MSFSATTVTIAVFITQFGKHKCEIIDTSTMGQFDGGIINCSSTENCTVICDEVWSCAHANIYCPKNYSCDIHCAAEYPHAPVLQQQLCYGATVHCPTHAPCTLNCTGDRSCEDILFNCPTNASCNVTCNANSCLYTRINWSPHETG
eukprot:790018_1